jgi:hypothetical protein
MLLIEDKLIDVIAMDLNFDPIEMKLILGNKYLEPFNKWINLTYQATSHYGFKRDYVKDLIVGPFAKNDYYNLLHCYIVSMENFETTFKVTLSFDYYTSADTQEIREIKLKELLDEKTY